MTQEALKLALDALENHTAIKHPQQIHYRDKAITAIKEALAQTQEPVAIVDANDDGYWADILPNISVKVGQMLYTNPPQRKPLTIGDVKIIWQNLDVREGVIMGLVRAVEAAHDIKENT